MSATEGERVVTPYCSYCRRRLLARFTYCLSCDGKLQLRLATLAANLYAAGFGQVMFEAGHWRGALCCDAFRQRQQWRPNVEGKAL